MMIYETEAVKMIQKSINSSQICMELTWVCFIFLFLYGLLLYSISTHQHRKFSTLCLGSVTLFTFWAMCFCIMDPNWIVGYARLISSFCHFLPNTITKADMTVNIGLSKMNITYTARTIHEHSNDAVQSQISYNEEFGLRMGYVPYRYDDPSETMKLVAFKRGLPNAILIVAELFSRNEGYAYGRMVNFNGDFVHLCLMSAIVLNALGVIFMISVPRYGYTVYIGIGLFLIFSGISYVLMSPYFHENHLRVEGVPIKFHFGRSCHVILAAGVTNLLLGIVMYLLVYIGYCDNISTFFELDYDSPWGCKELEKCMREDRIGCMKRLEEKKGLTNDLNFETYPYFLGKGYGSAEKFEHSLPSYNQATKEVDSTLKQFQIYDNSVIVRRNAGGISEFTNNRANESKREKDNFAHSQIHRQISTGIENTNAEQWVHLKQNSATKNIRAKLIQEKFSAGTLPIPKKENSNNIDKLRASYTDNPHNKLPHYSTQPKNLIRYKTNEKLI